MPHKDYYKLAGYSMPTAREQSAHDMGLRLKGAGTRMCAWLSETSGKQLKYDGQVISEGPHGARVEFTHRQCQGDRQRPGYFLSASFHPSLGYTVESGYKDGWGRKIEAAQFNEVGAEDLCSPSAMFNWLLPETREKANPLGEDAFIAKATELVLQESMGFADTFQTMQEEAPSIQAGVNLDYSFRRRMGIEEAPEYPSLAESAPNAPVMGDFRLRAGLDVVAAANGERREGAMGYLREQAGIQGRVEYEIKASEPEWDEETLEPVGTRERVAYVSQWDDV